MTGDSTENGHIPDFFIDRYEVSNQQFKTFMDAGGYQNRNFWKHAFYNDELEISWAEAMALFKDKTGLPGPSTWEAGDYADGEDDLPVSGVSWYEAAAYAEFAGKTLPSLDHSNLAGWSACRYKNQFLSKIITASNFSHEGLVSATCAHGMNYFGTYNMAGNVREWCWNKTGLGRVIRGGAWNDDTYLYMERSQMPALDRSSKNGFRCVQYIEETEIPPSVLLSVKDEVFRDYYVEDPVSDEMFELISSNFTYGNKDLDTRIEFRNEHKDDYWIEKVSYSSAYQNDRVEALLYLPKNTSPPYQTIVYFPHAGAFNRGSIEDNTQFAWQLKFLVKNGRAVFFPEYFGTFGKNDTSVKMIMWNDRTLEKRDIEIKMIKDFKRSIDYLETRTDIDTGRLAYFGVSIGARFGLKIPAVEDRIKVSILSQGGLPKAMKARNFPQIDEINFLPRITIPVLMLNGKYDPFYPYEISVKPAYDLLGTPISKKKLVVYELDHSMPRNNLTKETLIWLDEHLGPVKKNNHHLQ